MALKMRQISVLRIVRTNIETFMESGTYEKMFDKASKLKSGIQELINESGLKGIVQGVGPLFQIFFTERDRICDYRDFCAHVNRELYPKFVYALFARGVYTDPVFSAVLVFVASAH